ncbi:MBL fold metallo-hydrolase [Thermomonospora umbrina]|uniref:Metallo-beta-lactamase superfamily protein n=1 Tax=Thermomonospora umbrina TaxID=111806 RepID=A0A3D9SI44_9ACTN|nr:MBL fold metallo-hydrolase [Thermomonospora umbrina]REE95572.1 metallo-beta-lactamase superfamily protein [Thermomonospora umbrina]
MHDLSPKSIAGVDVIPLCDAVGPMGESLRKPLDETFPGASPTVWEHLCAHAPEAYGLQGEWVLHFHCFLLRIPSGPTVLVDTGLGGTDSPASSWAPVPGGLGDVLASAGVAATDVDVVVLTHLHSDHASGAVQEGMPAFPNARYVVQRRELDWLRGKVHDPVNERIVRPLREAGSLDAAEGRKTLADHVELVPTPGHTPGHQSVVVDDHRLVVSGDVVLHPVHLADEMATYVYDENPGAAAITRAELLRRIRERDGLLAAPHLPSPFVRP